MSKQPFPLKNPLVVEAFEKFNGNQKKKYKKFFSKHRYNEYLSRVFTFPKSAKNSWL
jgi:hypothetical protein